MPAPSCTCAPPRPRPAALVNREIRRLAGRATWTSAELAEYAELLTEEQAARAAEAEGGA